MGSWLFSFVEVFVALSGSFPDIRLYAKPVPKGKYDFQAKIAGWRIRARCVDGCIYKIVYRNTFLYAVQNKKGPAEAEPKICQQKRKWGSWFIVECFRPFDRLRDLVYTLLFVTLYDDFPSLTAYEGESRGRARLHMTKPRSRQLQAVPRPRRMQRANLFAHCRAYKRTIFDCHPLYIVEC